MTNMVSALRQTGPSWHDGGLFMGMHWMWWGIWIVTILVLLWAMVRLSRDRTATHRRVAERGAAEDVLRRRFAAGISVRRGIRRR